MPITSSLWCATNLGVFPYEVKEQSIVGHKKFPKEASLLEIMSIEATREEYFSEIKKFCSIVEMNLRDLEKKIAWSNRVDLHALILKKLIQKYANECNYLLVF